MGRGRAPGAHPPSADRGLLSIAFGIVFALLGGAFGPLRLDQQFPGEDGAIAAPSSCNCRAPRG